MVNALNLNPFVSYHALFVSWTIYLRPHPLFEKNNRLWKKKTRSNRTLKVKPLPIAKLSIYIWTSSTISTLPGLAAQHYTQFYWNKNKMAFMISRAESEAKKSGLNHVENKNSTKAEAISSQLQLKSSLSSKASSQTLSKEEVLHRIRHRKSLNRIKGAFEGLLGISNNTSLAQDQIWLHQDDAFSAPWISTTHQQRLFRFEEPYSYITIDL